MQIIPINQNSRNSGNSDTKENSGISRDEYSLLSVSFVHTNSTMDLTIHGTTN